MKRYTAHGEGGDVYECGCLAEVDQHLRTLTAELATTCTTTRLGRIMILEADRDMLLEVRLTMEREQVTS